MNCVKWKLLKYAKWEDGNWKLASSDPSRILALMIQELQLIIIQGDTVLESFSLAQGNKAIKSVYKNGTLVIAVKCQGSSFKFRVLFSSLSDGGECVAVLKKYIDVVGSEGTKTLTQTLPEMLAIALKDEESFPAPASIPDEYPLEDAIKLCILDPGFPKFVGRVEKIIKDLEKQ